MAGRSKFDICILPNLESIEAMVKKGAMDKDIAKAVHVSYYTFSQYLGKGREAAEKKKRGEKLSEKDEGFVRFLETYMRARQTPDAVVESALLLSCQDRTIEKKTTIRRYDPEGNLMWIEEKSELVPVAASVPAQQFYLANKKRKDWEYKPDANKQEETKEQDTIVIVAREKLNHGSDMDTTT